MTVPRMAAWVSAAAVAVALIAGFLLAGSPAEQRLERLDARRVADLQQIAWAVDDFRLEQGELPERLEQLVDGRRLSELPHDPQTAALYRYEPLPPNRYRLCARFDGATSSDGRFWAHPAGDHCFTLEARRPTAAR